MPQTVIPSERSAKGPAFDGAEMVRCHNPTIKRFLLYYTLAFAAITLVIVAIFLVNGKSFIRSGDFINQYYKCFLYLGRWFRDGISSLLAGQGFVLPAWDYSLGYGSDILSTLEYYGLTDPFNFISVIVPGNLADEVYPLVVLLKQYVSGLAFAAYCFYWRKSLAAVSAGALGYAWCSAAMFVYRFPEWILPLIFVPLVFLGMERILDGESPTVFLISLFLFGLSDFYHLYMFAPFAVAYGLVRIFARQRSLRGGGVSSSYFSVMGLLAWPWPQSCCCPCSWPWRIPADSRFTFSSMRSIP